MKIAYLVFAYKNHKLIRKTISCLAGEGVDFFVHIDAKFPISPFECICGENVFFSKTRIPVQWGEFSGVEAILLLMRQALSASPEYDYFVLLGGSEFPLRSGQYIRDFLERNRGAEFITMSKLPTPRMPMSRINAMCLPIGDAGLRLRAVTKSAMAQRDYRKHFGDLEPYKGITWWALSSDACRYIVQFANKDKKLAPFLVNTDVPEEIYIHTILGNSQFKSRIQRNFVYEDWPTSGPQHRPNMLTAEHLEYFESQDEVSAKDLHDGPGEMLFARKFSDENLHLVERLIAMIARKEKPPVVAAD